ncbi:hypothetical protein GRI39_08970 [Altererythrobacter indicus]|uniref:Regulatory protein RecX n=2 Tax=Altericroceibacterium indicum TaxID=374177 RepID=A0A845AC87_9SPHN|nr:hypothetical protein [Altericroceibacterium indicum]
MDRDKRTYQAAKRTPRPLDPKRFEEMALAYVARFATTAAKLEVYLKRKLRERGWEEGEPEPDIPALIDRFVAYGYVDDESYARAKRNSLLRKGYGPRRVSQALGAAGIAEDVREDLTPSVSRQRHAILAMARKKRFGPFGREEPDMARRSKQLASLLRAGHSLDNAREIINAQTMESAEEWAAEMDDEHLGRE